MPGSTPRPSKRRTSRQPPSAPAAEPSHADEAELDDRKAAILNAIVTEYISSAQPVGSQHVVGSPGVQVSSATVRSEMAALEREGYLVQPHTSAGRIPTDKGYRFFVDAMGEPGTLDANRRQQVRSFFDSAHGELESMLEHTSQLLARLTDCAAVVVAPPHDTAVIRSVQLVSLAPRHLLAVAVLSDGEVAKSTVELDADASPDAVEAAARHLHAAADGRSPAQGIATPRPTGTADVDAVLERAAPALSAALSGTGTEQLFVGGSSVVASVFDAVDTVKSVLSILEQQLVVVSLLRDVLDRGLSVAIGAEHGYEELASCALVVTPVRVGDGQSGTIGLIGPTRMNYPQAIAAAHTVGEQLGKRLGGTGQP